MFGKVIEFKRSLPLSHRGEELPDTIAEQFSDMVLEKELEAADDSRISHINFGRESYFGLITDPAGKSLNVHVTLHPDTKLLSKASCGCFRSNTRTYCHHIVSFIRYILRSDTDSGRLRSLEEDFLDSFWHGIGWYGYRNFGDSLLGFKASIDHGTDGIRISFSDRDGPEILSFMPGPRLVEEFLHEFFDLVKRDIDAVLFKRMFGRKMKDPKVPSLRRRPWAFSEPEDRLNKRGLKSTRQHHEDSLWHRIAKVGFLVAGRSGGDFHFSFLEHRQELTVEATDEDEEVILRLAPPRSHIGAVIELGQEQDAIGSDLFIHPKPLKTGHQISVADSSALTITPVVENPDPEGAAKRPYLDRTKLDDQLFAPYYFFPEWGFLKIEVSPAGLPAEYFSSRRVMTVPPEEITQFIEQHGDTIRNDPDVFVDESVLQRRTLEGYKEATISHTDFSEEGVSIDVNYDFGDFQLSFGEIREARRNRQRFLVHGDRWVDAFSSQFDWMDAVDDDAVADNRSGLRMTRTEYIRFIAVHDNLRKQYSSKRIQEWFQGLEKLKAPTRLPSLSAMKGKLRGYQKNGYGWLWFMYENRFSGLLCDDMGLGKTHQVMALMTGIAHRLAKRPRKLRYLVICPTTVLSHWKDKLDAYCPHLDPVVYHGTDRSFEEAFEEHTTIVTSYGVALRDIEILADYQFELIILDEIQAVKNKFTKTHAAIKALQCVCAIGLSGTPIENSLTDLKSLFDIVLPGYLMSDSLFETHFRIPIEEAADRQTEERLYRTIHPFILRRKKEQVLKELPPKIEDLRRCGLTKDQMRFYKDVAENQGHGLVQKLKDPNQKVPYMHIFAVLNYLKQICDHPVLLESDRGDYNKYSSGKWDLFLELLDESLGSGQKVVVFSQYVKMLYLIESYLKKAGISFSSIKGTTRNRGAAVRTFAEDPDCMVFTASLRASGLGIDLTPASVVIHYDRWWNSAREDQATDRVHRIGQTRGVQVFKLVTENTLEEKIDIIISKKKKLMESVVRQDDQALLKHFSREELIELISFGPS